MENTTLLPAAQWAQKEFGLAPLGDQRRSKRLVKIATQLAAHPEGTLPQAFPDWAELKAAYRFLGQRGVIYEHILRPHWERTQEACHQPGEYLLIEDTTLLDYSQHPRTENLGMIGDGQGRGFERHSTLAVRVEGGTLEQRPEGTAVGWFGQSCRTPRPVPAQETRSQRLSRPRKSQTWAAASAQAGGPPAGCQWIYIADRESDFYEPLQLGQQHGVDFIVRASVDRRLADGAGHWYERLGRAPVLGRGPVEARARPGPAARTAILDRRRPRVDLDGPWRPGGWKGPRRNVGVVEVREVDAPEGVSEPLHWILLTSWPCATKAPAPRVVGRYLARWGVEEYHKALKTGTGGESSPLEKADRLEGWIAVLAVVAVRLLSTKMLARSRPESGEAAASFGPEMLALLEKKLGPPRGGWTNHNVMIATARLGGFLARKCDGLPGWQTIWRGWQRLMWMCEGVNLMQG